MSSFDSDQPRYVSRCGRGAAPIQAEAGDGVEVEVGSGPPETGAVSIDPGVPPGEDFEIAIADGNCCDLYEVRCLPADFPAWRFESLRETEPGFFVVSFKASREERPWVIVFDHEGVPRWWYSPDRLEPRAGAGTLPRPAQRPRGDDQPLLRLGQGTRRRRLAIPAPPGAVTLAQLDRGLEAMEDVSGLDGAG